METSALQITFVDEIGSDLNQQAVERHLDLILQRLGYPDRLGIEVVFVGDKKIKELNERYRGKNEPTDVLSFPTQSDGIHQRPFLGSIVISVDTARKQATEAGIRLVDEVKSLAGHGLLHLLGYHHA